MRRFALLAALIAPLPAFAEGYSGAEAEALKCAYTISFGATYFEARGELSAEKQRTASYFSVRMLEQHVSGAYETKMSAFETLRRTHEVPKSVGSFREEANRCLAQFPVK